MCSWIQVLSKNKYPSHNAVLLYPSSKTMVFIHSKERSDITSTCSINHIVSSNRCCTIHLANKNIKQNVLYLLVQARTILCYTAADQVQLIMAYMLYLTRFPMLWGEATYVPAWVNITVLLKNKLWNLHIVTLYLIKYN